MIAGFYSIIRYFLSVSQTIKLCHYAWDRDTGAKVTPMKERKMFLNGKWVEGITPETKMFWERWDQQVKEAKAIAQEYGFEVLTPLAAVNLFNITPAAVRAARNTDKVHAPFALWITDREVELIDLQSALDYWRRHVDPPELKDQLKNMRENGHTLAVDQTVYNVLHVRPLVSLSNASELEGEVK